MGIRLVFDRSAQVLAELGRQVESILELGAQVTQQEAVQAIRSGGRSGRVYLHRGRSHQASARGEAPANRDGDLADSITIERPSSTKRRVVVGEEYGAILELRKGRAFLLPAFYRSVPVMRARLRQLQRSGGWRSGRPLRRALHYRSQVSPRMRRI